MGVGGRAEMNNLLIDNLGLSSYLEIGCRDDECFAHIRAGAKGPPLFKVGVDPEKGGTHRMTSDAYFEALRRDLPSSRFDLIFIDGDHRYPQVLKDVANALDFVSARGLITMHDCWLPSPRHEHEGLSGTAWRAFAYYRQRPDLDGLVCKLDNDPCALAMIVKRANPSVITLPPSLESISYPDMIAHEHDWMRHVDFEAGMRHVGLDPATVRK